MTDTDTTELHDSAEIRDGKAIVTYSRTEAALATLRAKYKDARYDLTTTAGDKAARAARLELVNLRAGLEKKRKELKAPALDFGKKVDGEAARITAEILTLEAPIDAQIKADEQRREIERKAKEEAEAARRKKHTDAIARIAGYLAQAAGLPSTRLADGIAKLEAFDVSGFEEFQQEAADTLARTVAGLRALHAKALASEEELARLEAQRVEQARIAAEQAEAARKLQEQAAELARQREAIAAEERRQEAERQRLAAEEEAKARAKIAEEQRAQAAKEAAEKAEADRLARQAAEAERPAEPLPPVVSTPPAAVSAPSVVAIRPTPEPMAGPPSLKLGDINTRLRHCRVTADDLAGLGFEPAARERGACLYYEHQFPGICNALIGSLVRARDHRAAA